jgi:SAM-dependent methyltransferase
VLERPAASRCEPAAVTQRTALRLTVAAAEDVKNAEFRDRRLVEIYDLECLWAPDDDLFVALVGRAGAVRVLDLGCGTGRLTIGLAVAGHQVTGIDPVVASLDAARRKPGAAAVTWIDGTSADAPSQAFDAAVMTSHVAQFLTDDGEWQATLADLKRVLVPGGLLAFDSRDPAARAWLRWNSVDSRHSVVLSDGAAVDVDTEVTTVVGDLVSFTNRYAFSDGASLESTATLRFRSEDDLRATLGAAGFTVETIFGGWQRQPVGHGDGEFVVVARS